MSTARDEPLLLGVRHHGPGSARAVRAALDARDPAVVLIEGPPEADALAGLAAEDGMRPPVALLAHVTGEPARAAFWPLAEFSPEWVALRWALTRGVPVRFFDLPAANTLALRDEDDHDPAARPGRAGDGTDVRIDPIGVLAETAGYDDPERWWEDVVEHRGPAGGRATGAPGDPFAAFAALGDAMAVLRETYGDGGHERDLLREAHMRLRLREARRESGDRVAVVCGAWHVPALRAGTTATADRQLLKGMPKVKAELTWVPWTNRRLSRHSGYGAGIASPGWYGHLFGAPDRPIERWMTKVAGLLRAEDHPVSSAHVIEAVRLAETLAAMRGRPLAGLAETTDAVRAVMCEGSDVPLGLVGERLVVGDVLGEVPESAPAVPLQRDLSRAQRSLRLKPEASPRELELDLRKETDAARSRLLHRLRLLGIAWGEPVRSRAGLGTFREAWRLSWEPELSVRVAEAGSWGNTVLAAATAKAEGDAVSAGGLADVTALAEVCLLAGLPDALPVVMRVLADRAALDADVGHLAQALPALVRSVRYGDVRDTDAAALTGVAVGLAGRVFAGLPPACTGLDADGAAGMRSHVDSVHTAVGLLDGAEGANGQRSPVTAPPGAPAALPDEANGANGRPEPVPAGDGGSGRQEPLIAGDRGSGSPEPVIAGDGASGRPDPVTAGGGANGQRNPGTATDGGPVAVPDGMRERWAGVLRTLSRRETVAPLIRGRAVRLLLDEGRMDEDEAAGVTGLALSPGTEPAEAAAWIEGFAGGESGGGMLLLHDPRLLGLLDRWLTGVPAGAFTDVLPLLRRTFGAYEPGVRRSLGELVRRGTAEQGGRGGPGDVPPGAPGFGPGLDEERAAAVEPVLRLLLGTGRLRGGGCGRDGGHLCSAEPAS
uniref:DUF5682 family protein n=1 Tax=Streptomyces lycii TaxID=2654337 RepID=UPI001F44A536|nr:DUF5682 family protein [Streptomyces lycii]